MDHTSWRTMVFIWKILLAEEQKSLTQGKSQEVVRLVFQIRFKFKAHIPPTACLWLIGLTFVFNGESGVL